jgi:hypothetical protein
MTRDTYLKRSLGTMANRIKEVLGSPRARLQDPKASLWSILDRKSVTNFLFLRF